MLISRRSVFLLVASCLVLALVCSAAAAPPAQGQDRIWSGLVLASTAEKPKAPPAELQKLAPKIERFFGYNQLELIGSATKLIDEECERWLVPSQHFWLCIKSCRAPEDRHYLLNTALYHDQKQIVETQAKLAAESPLIIRGPMHARGQILIVVLVQK